MTAIHDLPACEPRSDVSGARHAKLVSRLNDLSVTDHFEAYRDIDWDSPEMAVDPTDPRWELPSADPLAATAWYRALPADKRARIGLDRMAFMLKVGLDFERALKQGLLAFAGTLPNGATEFRYVYHELIEEAQHSLMFQEFINRAGSNPKGLTAAAQIAARFISDLGRRIPHLFFFFVIAGEEPIDYIQRKVLRGSSNLHPLVERVMQIHVTEEARHLSFAQSYLRTWVPKLGWFGRLSLALIAPIIVSIVGRIILMPSAQLVRRHNIPTSVLREAYQDSAESHADTMASVRRVRRLCEDLGLHTPVCGRLWHTLGLRDATRGRLRSRPYRSGAPARARRQLRAALLGW